LPFASADDARFTAPVPLVRVPACASSAVTGHPGTQRQSSTISSPSSSPRPTGWPCSPGWRSPSPSPYVVPVPNAPCPIVPVAAFTRFVPTSTQPSVCDSTTFAGHRPTVSAMFAALGS
jgi:hypothetical protein